MLSTVLIPAAAVVLAALIQRDHVVSKHQREDLADASKHQREDLADVQLEKIGEVHVLVNSRVDALIAEVARLKEDLLAERAAVADLQQSWDGIERRSRLRTTDDDYERGR